MAKIHYAINSDKDRWSYPFAICGHSIPEGSNVAYTKEDTTCKRCLKLLENDDLDEMIVSAFFEAAQQGRAVDAPQAGA